MLENYYNDFLVLSYQQWLQNQQNQLEPNEPKPFIDFFKKYQTPILIGGGILAAFLIYQSQKK
jgi:hypothetical protein